jgi:hypothetical protein
MRIAIVLDIICLTETESNTRKIMLFDLDGDLITAVDEDLISISDIIYLCLWLLAKQVKRLYCDDLTDAGHEFLRRVGVAVYPLSAIRSHPMLQALLLKDNKKNG